MDKRKVIARKVDGAIVKGYVEMDPIGQETLTIISLTDQALHIPKKEVKALFFVKKFSGNKDYSEVKFFETQPKIDGLWVRLTFVDNEVIEGIVANTITFLRDDGFYLKPPDPNSNNRLMYVVKAALKEFTVLGVQYSKSNIVEYFEKLHGTPAPEVKTPS